METVEKSEICSKLTIKTPEWRHWCCSGVFIVDFEQVNGQQVFQLFSHMVVQFFKILVVFLLISIMF